MADYPDYYVHVERSPIQPTVYQIPVVYNYLNRSVSPLSQDEVTVALPDDGCYYNFDSFIVATTATGLMRTIVRYTDDVSSGVWRVVSSKRFQYDCEIVPAKLGGLQLIYPGGVDVIFYNESNTGVYVSYYIVGFRYILE